MKKNRALMIFCVSFLSILGIGLLPTQRVVAANIPDWGVTVGQEIRWDTSLTMTATMSSKMQGWIKEQIPAFDLTQILQTINFNHEVKVTITSISDLSEYMGYPGVIDPGDGDLINGSIVARPAGTTTWGSPGTIIGDYFSAGVALLNTYYALLGIPTMPQYYIDYVVGNITAANYANVPISAWMKLSGLPALPAMVGTLPVSYLPMSYMMMPMMGGMTLDFLVMPKGIDFRQLDAYANEFMSMYTPEYSIENLITKYGASVEINERDASVAWGSNEFMKYMIETYGNVPWSPYADNSKADLATYQSFDANGLLSASVLYADIAATMKVDLSPYGGPNLNGESFSLSAEMKIGQPNAIYPSKNDLYIPVPLSSFVISMIGLSIIAGVSIGAIIISKRRK